MMADLFRKSSLEKISSPEQLDKTITITSPMSWLALLGITLIIAITLVWAIFGSLPTTHTYLGVLVSPVNANALFADDSGEITEILVKKGDVINKGDELFVIKNALGVSRICVSSHAGRISEVLVQKADYVMQGNEVFRITPEVEHDLIIISYVPLLDAATLQPGMKTIVNFSLSTRKSEAMEAEIIKIDSYAASITNMAYVLGNDNMLVNQFVQQGPVVAVTSKISTDDSDTNKTNLSPGTLVSLKIVTEESAPISKLFFNRK